MRRKRRRRAAPSSSLQCDLMPGLLDAVTEAPAKKPELNLLYAAVIILLENTEYISNSVGFFFSFL